MIRAVVDTNVLVSGFISPYSYPREVEKRWRQKEFNLVMSHEIIDEIDRVLHLPRIRDNYRLAESDIQVFILTLAHQAELTTGKVVVKGVAPDPGDDKIIACALEARADFIVTGDKALQGLGYYESVRIVSPEAFIQALEEATN